MQTAPVSTEDPYLLLLATLYVALTEAAGTQFEADVNRMLRRLQRQLPPDAAELCDYLLGFASREKEEDQPTLALN
jgi:hypothetical protein